MRTPCQRLEHDTQLIFSLMDAIGLRILCAGPVYVQHVDATTGEIETEMELDTTPGLHRDALGDSAVLLPLSTTRLLEP